ncbi:MAG: inositol 2-dehydrogenase, partial [Mesorhizobium sp.]
MIDAALFGAGLIGSVHAKNLARHPDVHLRTIVDPRRDAAE